MSAKHPIEIFMPPNILKAKVGGSVAAIDTAAIKRAEVAVEQLQTNFQSWIGDDVENLASARDGFVKAPDTQTQDRLFRCSHDLKGQGETFGFPLVARIAASLCDLLEGVPLEQVPVALLDAHVDAIRVCMRDRITGDSERIATMLANELEARVQELVGPEADAAD